MTTYFGVIRADATLDLADGPDIIGPDKDTARWKRNATFFEVYHDAIEKMRTLHEKFHRNHPDYEGRKAIGFFYIDEGHDDIVKLFEDCAGDKSVSDLLAKLRDTYPHDVALCEKRIAELQTDEKSDEKTIGHEDDTMTKQLIYDISNAVKLKYVKTTRWVWDGIGTGMLRPAKKHETPSLEIEHYDVVYEVAAQDEQSVPFTDEIMMGEALGLEDRAPFLITIKGRKYYQHGWNIQLDGNEVINYSLYLNTAVSERCPDGWAGDLPDYIDYEGTLYRAETVETDEESD